MALATVFSYILIEFTSLVSLSLVRAKSGSTLECFSLSFIWSEGPLWVDNWLTALMGRAQQISQLNEAMKGKGAQFMLILKPPFCCSKEAAEGNQMTMIVGRSEGDKCGVQICSSGLSVRPQSSSSQTARATDRDSRVTTTHYSSKSHSASSSNSILWYWSKKSGLQLSWNWEAWLFISKDFDLDYLQMGMNFESQ